MIVEKYFLEPFNFFLNKHTMNILIYRILWTGRTLLTQDIFSPDHLSRIICHRTFFTGSNFRPPKKSGFNRLRFEL